MRCATACVAALAAALAFSPVAAWADAQEAAVTSYSLSGFKIGSGQTQFGPLAFVGGFSMTSPNRNFGALSGFRFLDGTGTRFVAVADNGFLVTGAVSRDAATGVPTGFSTLALQELPDLKDQISTAKWETDAESLDYHDGAVFIGFERRHRISEYAFDGTTLGKRRGNLDFLIPPGELRSNRGFEALARAPQGSVLDGALVAISEKSIDRNGNIFAAVLDGPRKGMFTIARSDEFDITDGDFLPSGDLILLERSYQLAQGVRMRLRRIAGADIVPGAVVAGDILLEADMRYQIDNMEGLDIWQAADGTTRLSLVSDDNKSILQRNLYLEFTLGE
jgi:hypothetical protein